MKACWDAPCCTTHLVLAKAGQDLSYADLNSVMGKGCWASPCSATTMHAVCVELQAMVAWWRQWVQQKQQQQELLESSCCHMEAYTMLKYVSPELA